MTTPYELGRLRRELAELQARQEIDELLALFGFYSDCGAVDEWLGLFCEDAFLDVPDYGSGDREATARLVGRDALRAGTVDHPVVQGLRGRMQHHMTGPRIVVVDGDTATVDSYGFVLVPAEVAAEHNAGGPVTPNPSFQRWLLRRADGAWRIAGCIRRQVDQSAPLLRELAARARRPSVRRTADGRPHAIRINHVAISVTDLRRSIAFYTEHLGLELLATQPAIEAIPGMAVVVGYPEAELHASWALLAAGSGRLELVCYRSPAGARPSGNRPPADVGLAHLAFEVDDVDALYARLVSVGVATVSAPVTLGRHRACYAHGPDGELIEVLEEYSTEPPHTPLD